MPRPCPSIRAPRCSSASARPSSGVDDPTAALEPIDLLADAVRGGRRRHAAPGARCSATSTRSRSSTCSSWKYPDPGALLARRVGRVAAHDDHDDGRRQLAADAREPARGRRSRGASTTSSCSAAPSACYTRWRARRAEPKVWLDWTEPDDPPCPSVWGDDRPGIEPVRDGAPRARADPGVPAVRDRAPRGRRARRRRAPARRRASSGRGFAAVAAENPHAWSRTPYTAGGDPHGRRPTNRMVTFPYPKRMCANIDVDQAAALLLCSYEAARAAGVPDDRLVFPLVGRRRARPLLLHRARARSPTSPAIGDRGRRRARRRRASASTTSRASTSTRASRPRSRSRCRRSGSAVPAAATTAPLTRHRRPRVRGRARATTTRRTRSRRWSTRAGSDPGLDRPRHRARAGTSRSTRSACTRPRHRRTASSRSTRRRPRRDGRRAAPARARRRRSTARSSSRRRRSSSSATAPRASALLTALTPDGRRALANTRDRDAMQSMCEQPWEGTTVALAQRRRHERRSIASTPLSARLLPAVPVGDLLDRAALRGLEVVAGEVRDRDERGLDHAVGDAEQLGGLAPRTGGAAS